MANLVHKQTLRFLKSVHTPDYLSTINDYIQLKTIEEVEALEVIPAQYRKLNTAKTKVVEMTISQKKVVDDANAERAKVSQAEQIISEKSRELAIEKGVSDGVLNSDGTLKE